MGILRIGSVFMGLFMLGMAAQSLPVVLGIGLPFFLIGFFIVKGTKLLYHRKRLW